MGTNEGRNKKPVAQTRVGRADRVYRVDARRSPETLEVRGFERRQRRTVRLHAKDDGRQNARMQSQASCVDLACAKVDERFRPREILCPPITASHTLLTGAPTTNTLYPPEYPPDFRPHAVVCERM